MKAHWPIFYDGFARLVGPEVLQACQTRLKLDPQTPEPVFGLTDLQQLALYFYTTPLDYYLRLNSELRDWVPAPGAVLPIEILVFAIGLENALRKLPVYPGIAYRGIRHPASLPERVGEYAIGSVHIWNAFTSATRDPDRAYAGNTAFRLFSKTGRSLAYVTADDDSEILFSAFSRFEVLEMLIVSNDDMVISMQELEP